MKKIITVDFIIKVNDENEKFCSPDCYYFNEHYDKCRCMLFDCSLTSDSDHIERCKKCNGD